MMLFWVVAGYAFYLFVSPLMGFFDRFLFSSLGLLLVLAVTGVREVMLSMSRLRGALVASALVAVHLIATLKSPRTQEALRFDQRTIIQRSQAVAAALSFEHPEQITLASADAGLIPFYSKLRHIDLVGLNDPTIARARDYESIFDHVIREETDLALLPLEHPAPGDSRCRTMFRGGHGLIAHRYLKFLDDLTREGFRKFLVFRSEPYDLLLVVNTRGKHAREVEAAISVQLMLNRDQFDAAPECVD
jgi:hypothetical protein